MEDGPSYQLVLNGQAYQVLIRDADDGVDYPCGYIYQGDRMLMAVSPFVSPAAPAWMVEAAVREALAAA